MTKDSTDFMNGYFTNFHGFYWGMYDGHPAVITPNDETIADGSEITVPPDEAKWISESMVPEKVRIAISPVRLSLKDSIF